jgi:hypothetical protein
MSYTMEIGPVGSPNLTLDASDLLSVDVAKPHTALADYDIEVPYSRDLRDRALDPVRIYSASGALLFRGYLKELDWDQQRGVTRLNGPGIGDDLKDSAIERSFTNTATHVAIQDVWDNDTDFDATVRPPSVSEIVTDSVVADADTTTELDALIDNLPQTAPVVAENGRLTLADSNYYVEGEDPDLGFDGGTLNAPGFSGGAASNVFADIHDPGWEFTTDYTIPEGDWNIRMLISTFTARWWDTFRFNYQGAGFDVQLDGTTGGGVSPGFGFAYTPQETVTHNPDDAVLDDSGSQTNYTTEINDDTADDVPLLPPDGSASAGDIFYAGFEAPWDTLELDISTPGDGSWTVVWEYYAEEYDDAGSDFDTSDDTLVDSGWREIPNVTDNTNGFRQSGTVEWSLTDILEDQQAGGDYTKMAEDGGPNINDVHVRARLDSFSSMTTQPLARQGWTWAGSKSWLTVGPNDGALEAGDHTVQLTNVDDDGENFITQIDGIVIEDERFNYDYPLFPNTYGGYLDGPQSKPDGYLFRIDQIEADFNVIGITLTTSNWSDTSGDQLIGVSFDGGATWYDAANATQIDQDVPSNVGKTVDARIRMDRHGTRDTATPRTGYLGQSFDTLTLDYDGSDLSIIQDDTIRGSPLQIQTDLHDRADYHFVIDHAATDGGGNLTKEVESFERGTETRAKDWTVVNRQPSRSFVKYANEVTIYGELKPDGTRPKVTVQDDGEVAEYGTEPYSETRPDLSTVDQVRAAAVSELKSRVKERDQKGTVQAIPTDVLPGYSYPVDWFADGSPVETPMERVQFSEGSDTLRATLKFAREPGVTESVIDQGFAIDRTREGI